MNSAKQLLRKIPLTKEIAVRCYVSRFQARRLLRRNNKNQKQILKQRFSGQGLERDDDFLSNTSLLYKFMTTTTPLLKKIHQN